MILLDKRQQREQTKSKISKKGKESLTDSSNTISLTQHQRLLLSYLEQGYTKQEISKKMNISVHTVDLHLRQIYEVMNVHSMVSAIAKAIREKLI